MKLCPYCAEEIQDSAIKCRYCGEWLETDAGTPGHLDLPPTQTAVNELNELGSPTPSSAPDVPVPVRATETPKKLIVSSDALLDLLAGDRRDAVGPKPPEDLPVSQAATPEGESSNFATSLLGTLAQQIENFKEGFADFKGNDNPTISIVGSQQGDARSNKLTRLQGFGGWLWLFVIAQWFPLVRLIGRSGGLSAALNGAPSTIMLYVLGIAVSMSLFWTGHSMPVKLVRAFILANFVVLLTIFYGTSDPPEGRIIGAMISCVIWFLYFTKSKRVHATYLTQGVASADQSVDVWSLRTRRVLSWGIAVTVLATMGVALSRTLKRTENAELKRELATLDHDVGQAADRLQRALTDVGNMNAMESASDAAHGISILATAQSLESESRSRGEILVDFIEKNKGELQAQGAGETVLLAAIYTGGTYEAYHDALSDFLTSYKEMLTYVSENFNERSVGSRQRKRYLALDAKYRAALETQNKAYYAHQAFVEQFGKDHPGLSEILADIKGK